MEMQFYADIPPRTPDVRGYIPDKLPYSPYGGYIRYAFGPELHIRQGEKEYTLSGKGIVLYYLPRTRKFVIYYSHPDYLPIAALYLRRLGKAYAEERRWLLWKYEQEKKGGGTSAA